MPTLTAIPEAFLRDCRTALGPNAVSAEPDELATASVDFWRQCEGRAALLVRPGTTAEVAQVVRQAAVYGVALVPQAGNTGLVAGGIPDGSGRQVLLSLARLNRVRAVDRPGECLIAEAGCTLLEVQAAAEAAGRLFPLRIGSEGTCRIGGNLSTNAGGVNVLRYGMARDLVLGLEVVLADGRIWDGLRSLRKDNTGYDLKQLFIGAEGTLGIITAASLRLFARPREQVTMLAGASDPAAALELLARAKDRFGELVTSFELMAGGCVELAVAHLDGVRAPLESRCRWYLLIELGWSLPEGLAPAAETWLGEMLEAGLVEDATIAQSEAQRAMLWRIREELSEAMRTQGKIARHDVSVPISAVPDLMQQGEALVARLVPGGRLLPFGHLGDGNLHFNIIVPPETTDFASVRAPLQRAVFDLVGELGGSISAEHGIGRLKAGELAARKPALDLELMRRVKTALDPQGILNPGVILA